MHPGHEEGPAADQHAKPGTQPPQQNAFRSGVAPGPYHQPQEHASHEPSDVGEVVGPDHETEHQHIDGPLDHGPLEHVAIGASSPPAVDHGQADEPEDRPRRADIRHVHPQQERADEIGAESAAETRKEIDGPHSGSAEFFLDELSDLEEHHAVEKDMDESRVDEQRRHQAPDLAIQDQPAVAPSKAGEGGSGEPHDPEETPQATAGGRPEAGREPHEQEDGQVGRQEGGGDRHDPGKDPLQQAGGARAADMGDGRATFRTDHRADRDQAAALGTHLVAGGDGPEAHLALRARLGPGHTIVLPPPPEARSIETDPIHQVGKNLHELVQGRGILPRHHLLSGEPRRRLS